MGGQGSQDGGYADLCIPFASGVGEDFESGTGVSCELDMCVMCVTYMYRLM